MRCWFFLLVGKVILMSSGFAPTLWAQVSPAQEYRQKALNQYIDFANESIHVLWAVHERLEAFNRDLIQYQQQGGDQVVFRIDDLIRDFNYYGILKGICARSYGVGDPNVNIRLLYEQTRQESGYIPESSRIALNQTREELMLTLIQVLGLCDTLALYTSREAYQQDEGLEKAMQIMAACSTHYERFQAQKNALDVIAKQVAVPRAEALTDLDQIMAVAQQLLRAIRQDNQPATVAAHERLAAAIERAEARQASFQVALRQLDLYYDRENTGYKHLIQYAHTLLRRAEEYLSAQPPSPAFSRYPPAYYQYNERMLAVYNHHKYGITAYYNRFVGFANRRLPKQVEETPRFEWIPVGDLPANAAHEVPPASPLDPLAGAATNHLVFLLDVSASMRRPEKLTLLKESLGFLLKDMRPEDRISVVTYSGDTRTILEAVPATERDRILEAINRLDSRGETNVSRGMRRAYALASRHFLPGGNNRVLLASDGAFSTGGRLQRLVRRKATEGITFSVLLFGQQELPQVRQAFEGLAELGQGNYAHVSPENAYQVLIREAKAVRKRD